MGLFTCNFLHGNGPEYAASTSIWVVIVRRLERRGVTAKDGIQKTTRFPGLGNGLTGRKSLGMLLEERRLADVE